MSVKEIRNIFFDTMQENFSFPIFLQGSMSDKMKYPDTFITYFIPTNETQNGDNKTQLNTFILEVATYSNDIDVKDETTEKIKEILKAKNFNFVMGGDVASDEPTHTGYMQRFAIII